MDEDEKEYITKEELEQELDNDTVALPKRHGRLAMILGAVLFIVAGAMTGYYWYIFQKQQGGSGTALQSAWDASVITTNQLVTSFNSVNAYADFLKLSDPLNQAQRAIRDAKASLPAATTADSVAQTRLAAFLDDYASVLVALDNLRSAGDQVSSPDAYLPVKQAFNNLEASHDDLLIAGRAFIKSDIPRSFFNFSDKLNQLLTTYLNAKGVDTQIAAALTKSVNDFMTAFIAKDQNAVQALLTTAAKASFNPGVLEDVRTLSNFSIISQTKVDDNNYTVRGQLKVTTPDNQSSTETWEFKMKLENSNWLIDSWNKV